MKILSLQQPWLWLIAHGLKDIENRDWEPRDGYRGPILLHASKTFDPHVYFLDGKMHGVIPFSLRETIDPAILPKKEEYELGGIVGIADLVAIHTRDDPPKSPWWNGRCTFGWVFENARPLPFHACKGQLWLFDFDESLLDLGEGVRR